jgi:hypothetical protein
MPTSSTTAALIAKRRYKMKNLSPLKAIRSNCLQCSCGSIREIKHCIITDCPLYPYRLGKNPNRKGIGGKIGNRLGINSKIVT